MLPDFEELACVHYATACMLYLQGTHSASHVWSLLLVCVPLTLFTKLLLDVCRQSKLQPLLGAARMTL